MELPIAPQSYRPGPDALVRAVKHADAMAVRLVADEASLDGAVAFTCPARPDVSFINYATDLHVPPGLTASRVVEQVVDHFARAGVPCHALECGSTHWPDDLAAAAEAHGYVRSPRAELYLLTRYQPPATLHTQVQIIPARAAYRELHEFCVQAACENRIDPALAERIARTQVDFFDEPRLDGFLARMDGRAVGVATLASMGQIGVIGWIHVAAANRNQGIGSALMRHVLDQCGRSQFEQVVLETLADGPACRWYQRQGFQAVTSFSKYVRVRAPGV